MKYVHFDSINGRILGYYSKDIHEIIPEPNVLITEEEWQTAIDSHANHIDEETMVISEVDFRTEDEKVEQERMTTNAIARKYLADTDWYITRKIETGIAVPAEISALRAEARLKVV